MLYHSKFKCHCTTCLSILLTELKYHTETVCLNAAVCEISGWENEDNTGISETSM